MLRKLLLSPYYLTLRLRHAMYDHGPWKVHKCEIPTICVGNISVGGTGKTPHTEMILRTLLSSERWKECNIAVLSRGYKRNSHGFQQVLQDGTASFCGDEPLQIKRKFPSVTVAVDRNRVEGCGYLIKPEALTESKRGNKCVHKDMPSAQLIILDDAFQYRGLQAYFNVVLVDYNRPLNKDLLLPFGRLRDLPSRLGSANVIVITKSPSYLEDADRERSIKSLGIKDYDPATHTGFTKEGKKVTVLFSYVNYCQPKPVFYCGDPHYIYAQKIIVFSGIAKDTPLCKYLSDSYKIVKHFNFSDHHNFSLTNLRRIHRAAISYPTALIATTEKDSQRLYNSPRVPQELKERMFIIPIEHKFVTDEERVVFETTLLSALDSFSPEY